MTITSWSRERDQTTAPEDDLDLDAQGARYPLYRLRRAAIATWLGLLVLSVIVVGVPLDREAVMAWIAAGLLVASIGRRPLRTVVVDWLPFALVLLVYDFARGAAFKLGAPTLWTPQIAFDKWLFHGVEPTVWLQAHLRAATPRWYDALATLVYASFFLMPYVVAGVLWLRSRREFRRWVSRFVVMSFLGVVGFVLIPAAPPWAAASCTASAVASRPSEPACLDAGPASAPKATLLGALPSSLPGTPDYVERISSRGFEFLHIDVAKTLLDKGQDTVDPVAAVPSLHAGLTLLFVLFMWPRVRWRWRVLLGLYTVAMAFALVYTAEHYVFDVLIGWALAVAVTLGFSWYERRSAAADVESPEVESLPSEDLAQSVRLVDAQRR